MYIYTYIVSINELNKDREMIFAINFHFFVDSSSSAGTSQLQLDAGALEEVMAQADQLHNV